MLWSGVVSGRAGVSELGPGSTHDTTIDKEFQQRHSSVPQDPVS